MWLIDTRIQRFSLTGNPEPVAIQLNWVIAEGWRNECGPLNCANGSQTSHSDSTERQSCLLFSIAFRGPKLQAQLPCADSRVGIRHLHCWVVQSYRCSAGSGSASRSVAHKRRTVGNGLRFWRRVRRARNQPGPPGPRLVNVARTPGPGTGSATQRGARAMPLASLAPFPSLPVTAAYKNPPRPLLSPTASASSQSHSAHTSAGKLREIQATPATRGVPSRLRGLRRGVAGAGGGG